MMQKEDITGIILAGGKSSRMGSDKGFMQIKGKSFMSLIIEALQPLVKSIIIVSDKADYDVFKLERVTDVINNAGPLAGIYSGLANSKTQYNLVLSCDVPLINSVVLKQLIKESDASTDIVLIKSEGKTMPLVALYKKSCKDLFLTQLKKGERRLQVAIGSLNIKTIKLAPEFEKYARNINTVSELKEIKNEFNN